MPLSPVGDIGIAIKSSTDDFHKGMRTSKESVGLLTGSVRNLSAAFRNAGVAITAASALAGTAMFSLSQQAERVNEAFREVGTISSEIQDVQGEYADLVSDLNTEFGLQANQLEVIDGLYQSLSAGVAEGEEAQREFLETAAELAVVGRVDLASTVDVLSTAQNAYGESTEFAERASNALFRTVQFGKIRLEELAPVMGRITALGAEMNVAIEELGASMAVLTRTGFESRVAATGLRNILRSLMRPSETMKELLRGVAIEQDGLVESLIEGHDALDGLAKEYREATDAIRELEDAQESARKTQEDASLAISEARLKITAIEEGRVDQLTDLSTEAVNNADSVSELESVIEDYRFQSNRARVEEEQARIEQEKHQDTIADLQQSFKEELDVQGDLEDGIGQLIVENEGLVGTLSRLREEADEQNIAFSELFPRTRALQAALALVGEDAELLNDIFAKMRDKGGEAGIQMLEENREELDLTEEEFQNLKDGMKDVPGLFDDISGPAQESRDAISSIKEEFETLGQLFVEDTTGLLDTVAEALGGITDFVESLNDENKSAIGRFAALAVSIGLLLGPVLLLVGQLGLIATSMGTGLIPLLGVVGTLVGGLAGAFTSVLNPADSASDKMDEMAAKRRRLREGGGEGPPPIFSKMEDIISSVIGFVLRLKHAFVENTLPGMMKAGLAFFSLIGTISSALDEFFEEEDANPLEQITSFIGEAFGAVGQFIDENEEMIASIVVLAAQMASNAVPAIIAFARGLGAVVNEFIGMLQTKEAQVILSALATAFTVLNGVIADVMTFVGNLMQKHSGLVSTILLATGAVLGVMAALSALSSILSAVSVAVGGLLFILGPAVLVILALIAATALVIHAWRNDWANIREIAANAITFIMDLVSVAFRAMFFLPLLLLAFWRDGFSGVRDFVDGFFDDLVSLFFDSGKALIKSLAEGLVEGISAVKDAAGKVTNAISSYLPSSYSEEGVFAQNSPSDYGENITGGIAEGAEDGLPEVENSLDGIGENLGDDVESDIDIGGDVDGPGTGGSGLPPTGQATTDITVDEKAVYFEEGAFQGIADEEIPEKVREEVDGAMEEIVEDLESTGHQDDPRRDGVRTV